MSYQIELPVTALELEGRIHDYCDHHGWDFEVVGSEYQKSNGETGFCLLLRDRDIAD